VCLGLGRTQLHPPGGGKGKLIVDADTMEVGVRAANIVIETDSKETEKLTVKLFMKGYLQPPYLFQTKGDLYFIGKRSTQDVRDFSVDTVEPLRSQAGSLQVKVDLPFMRIEPTGIDQVPFVGDEKMVVRTYRYRISLRELPPNEPFSGQVTVQDPWRPERLRQQSIIAEADYPISVAPSNLVLRPLNKDGGILRAQFAARLNRGVGPLHAAVEGVASPLIVQPLGAARDGGYSHFEVLSKAGQKVSSGTFMIKVTAGADALESVTIPVIVPSKEG